MEMFMCCVRLLHSPTHILLSEIRVKNKNKIIKMDQHWHSHARNKFNKLLQLLFFIYFFLSYY